MDFMKSQNTFIQNLFLNLQSLTRSLHKRLWQRKSINGRKGFQRKILQKLWSIIRRDISSRLKAVIRVRVSCLYYFRSRTPDTNNGIYCIYSVFSTFAINQ